MSGVYLAVCRACTYSEGFKFGVAAKFSCLDSAACLVHPDKRSEVQEIANNNGLSETAFGYRAFHCPSCNNLCDGFWVRIENGGSDVYETVFHCKKCGDAMVSLSEPDKLKTLPCPDCYNTDLEMILVMPWD